MEKIEWRKDKSYSMKKSPQILEVPKKPFFSIRGIGDPNQEDFKRRVACLYAVSYAIRMSPKKNWLIPDYQMYTVYPLEGQWGLQEKYLHEPVMKKEHFSYQLMIRQPDFVTEAIAQEAIQRSLSKLPEDLREQVAFGKMEEGLCAQILHIGSYHEEPESFEKLEAFIAEEGYQRTSKEHKEIYISDPRKSAPEKMKTMLRVKIEKR